MLCSIAWSSRWVLRVCAWWGVFTMALASPIAVSAVSALPAQNMTLLGLYGGAMHTVTVDGTNAFIGQGTMVVIMDVSDHTRPQRVGFSDFLPGDVKAIAVSHDYTYAALGVEGLAVLDVSNLAAPSLVTIVDTVGSAEDVVVAGDHLFVASGLAGLRIFDLGDPAQPVPLGNVNTPGFTYQLVVDGTTAYLADGRGGLRIVDVTTPATPQELGFFDAAGEITSVAYGNGFAYVVGYGSYELRAIDVTDPAAPREESVVSVYWLQGVELAGDYLYVRMDSNLLAVFNSDPFLLNQVGYIALNSFTEDVAIADGYAFVTGGAAGLHILDIDPPAAIAQVGRVNTLTQASRVAVNNRVAYVPDGTVFIAALDISNPHQITEQAGFATCGSTWHQLTIAGNTLVIDSADFLQQNRQLCFFSLSNPLAPQKIGQRGAADNQWYSPRVATQGSRIFVAEATAGVTELNPADLSGEPLGVYVPTRGSIRSVAIPATGDLLLAATGDSLLFIDIATPGAPQLLGELMGPYGGDMKGNGSFVYAYNSQTKAIDIIDIQTPESPHRIASIELPGDNAKRILPVGDLLLVANGSAGVRAIDISTPTEAKEVAFFDPPADASGIAVEGTRVYVAANDKGLMVLQLDDDLLPRRWTLALPLVIH